MVADPAADASTQDRIRSLAADLYVLKGYDGFSFGDIAEQIGTTRANIHHHFGNKRKLMDELIEVFAGDAVRRIEQTWMGPPVKTFEQRLTMQLEDLRRFYARYNQRSERRNVWSPLSRLRHDLAVLGEPAFKALERANQAYDRAIKKALDDAVKAGELSKSTPVADLTRMLRVLLLSCPPMTQDGGGFGEIEKLFELCEGHGHERLGTAYPQALIAASQHSSSLTTPAFTSYLLMSK